MSFTRKRAALACAYCRHRKRRCDSEKPSCSNCIESDVECQYDDAPSQRIDTSGGSREIIGRLRDIEALLQTQAQSIAALTSLAESSSRPYAQPQQPDDHLAVGVLSHSHAPATGPSFTQALPTNSAFSRWQAANDVQDVSSPPLTIPVKHKTSSSYLLSLPAMRSLVGEYPRDLFFQLESRNPLPAALTLTLDAHPSPSGLPEIDASVTDYLVSTFFATAHHNHPILDEVKFRESYSKFLETGVDSTIDSALCLVVCALGAAASASPDELQHLAATPPGMKYMRHALPTLVVHSSWYFSYNIQIPQALVLASIYFAYIVRPLQSWRLIYSASTILQFKLSRLDPFHEHPSSIESLLRLFWTCFLVECDRLAELELPRSSIQQLTDETSLPDCTNLGDMESTCYLAEISIRRLLNSIHNSIYPKKDHVLNLSSTTLMAHDAFTTDEISSMGSVCEELHRQLDMWHTSIPEPYRPTLGVEPVGNDRGAVLRIRYFAARHIIYRPFVLYIAANPNTPNLDSLVEKSQICIESCRRYLRNTAEILRRPSQYTWTFSLSSLGAVVVLTLSSLSPDLKHLVPDIDELQTLAINNIRPWAISSLEAVVSILEDMQRKQRLLSRV